MILRYIFFLFIPFCLYGQFTDDFSDGDFTTNPEWTGNIEQFEILDGQLHLNDTIENEVYLSTAVSTQDLTTWEFFVKLDFNPSTSNLMKVYMKSNVSNLLGDLNGYFVRIGESGSEDGVDLYRQNGGSTSKIIDGVSNNAGESPELYIKVTRDMTGNWELFTGPDNSGANYVSEGTAMDDTHNSGNYIGIVCDYTKSNSAGFYFDDFFVDPIFVDDQPPQIVNANTISPTEVVITFSEPLDLATAQNPDNYNLTGVGEPVMAILDVDNPTMVTLTFDDSFPTNQDLTLTINNLMDLSGNVLSNGQVTFTFSVAASRDVIINEIFPDPAPVVGLPEAEFVELYNQTTITQNLSGWLYGDATSEVELPEGTTIEPNGYLIICKNTEDSLWQSYGPTLPISSFPSLNNGDDILSLKDQFGNLIDQVAYDDAWYGDEVKRAGGWTLELVDASFPCQGSATWTASQDPSGGTPGRENSITMTVVDEMPPDLWRVEALGSQLIALFFSEDLDASSALDAGNYSISPSVGISEVNVQGDQVSLFLSEDIVEGTIYTITVSNITDCSGNIVGMFNQADFGLAQNPEPYDVVINEILFNPATGGFDYVELYNRSDKIINLSPWYIGRAENADALDFVSDTVTIVDSVRISDDPFSLFPEDYVVLTENAQWVMAQYGDCDGVNEGKFLEVDLPTYSADGMVGIMRASQEDILDKVQYTEDWHFRLLDEDKGVSLERIDPFGPSQDENNWHSASQTSCFGTPTYLNSQFFDSPTDLSQNIEVTPKVFAPTEEGSANFTQINYQFDEPGYTVNITVFDDDGRKIRRLVQSGIVGREGFFKWDGTDDAGEKALLGIYVIYVEAFNLNGTVSKLKETCVIGGNLD